MFIVCLCTDMVYGQKNEVSVSMYYSAPYGDFETSSAQEQRVYNVISNKKPDTTMNNSNWRYVNVNRGVRVFASFVGSYAGAQAPTSAAYDYIEIDGVTPRFSIRSESLSAGFSLGSNVLNFFANSQNVIEVYEDKVLMNQPVYLGTQKEPNSIQKGISGEAELTLMSSKPQLNFVDDTQKEWAIVVDNDNLGFNYKDAYVPPLMLTQNGLIGIGTSQPDNFLSGNG